MFYQAIILFQEYKGYNIKFRILYYTPEPKTPEILQQEVDGVEDVHLHCMGCHLQKPEPGTADG